MKVSRLGYLSFTSADLPGWRRFGTGVIGAMDVPGTEGDVRLKIDEHPFRIRVEADDADRLSGIGWELASRADHDALYERLNGLGLKLRDGDAAGAAKRCVADYFATEDPAGNTIEFYCERTGCGDPFRSPAGVRGFVTGEMGLGHVVVPAAGALEETHGFYRSALGFGASDDLTIALPIDGVPPMRVLFMHADNPRHHSLALFSQPSPTGIVHLMLELEDIDEVGRCLDRVGAHGLGLMATLGRHCNDNMLSFYVNGPAGVAVEIGCEGLQLDWTRFEPTVSSVADHWGHAYRQLADGP
ncbi:VOC family protein [Sphingomonas sp. YL-JM2C]